MNTVSKLHIAAQGMNLFDFVSTALYLKNGRQEANPLILWVMNIIGEMQGLATVKIVAAGLLYFLYVYSTKYLKAYTGLWIASVIYFFLTLWHIFVWTA